MVQKIEVIRGTSNPFEITITDANHNLYTLGAGEKVLFGVKKDPDDQEYIFLKTITTGTNGVFAVTVDPEDTADIAPGYYFSDVGLQAGNDYFNVIEPSPFDILQNVTKWGDGD